MIDELTKLFNRDIDRLINEILAFHQEDDLWRTTNGISNSAGNLSLHLIGNLNTYIGRNMGSADYIRNRDSEFKLKNIPRQEIIAQIKETKNTVLETIRHMDEEKLEAVHQEDALGYKMTNRFFFIHLASHLSYHLGQINYLRRILENNKLQPRTE